MKKILSVFICHSERQRRISFLRCFTSFSMTVAMATVICVNLCFAEAKINSVSGRVTVNNVAAIVGQRLNTNDVVKTSAVSNSVIVINGHEVTVSEKTEAQLAEITDDSSLLKIWLGKIRAKVNKLKAKQKFEIKTPTAICAVRGTEFAVEIMAESVTRLEVYAGIVSAKEETTGGEVLVNPGEFTTVKSGEAPKEPQKLEESKKTEAESKETKEDFKSEAQREIFMEISRDAVKERAADEIKLAEYQNGKALMDVRGYRVRLEEYVYRPPENKNQFKYVVLNERENRFDFGKILFTFNKDLPTDLNDATKHMFEKEGSTAPEWYLTNLDSVMSNTYDKILEEASGGKMIADDAASPTSWFLFFGSYKFYIGNTDTPQAENGGRGKLMWQFVVNGDNTAKPDEFTYLTDVSKTQTNGFEGLDNYTSHTDPAVSTFSRMPDGDTTFHFAYKDLYADGTTVEKHNYIINDDGKVQTFSDIASSDASADKIKEKILTLNFENVYTSSLFSDKYSTDDGFGKRIDLIFSSKLLSDAGILQLPSSLTQ
ncbi:MAG: FecR family protein [Elusimicrobiota bacterium]|nr:FecR family protein [Elusimicrobiota bacterium]